MMDKVQDDKNCRFVCIDIDGTLLNDAKVLLPEVKRAVKEQYENGRRIALVSGRMPCAVSQIEEQLGIDCIKICNAGTFIIADGKCIREEMMSAHVMRLLYEEIAEKHNVALWVYQGYEWYVNRIDNFVENEMRIIRHKPNIRNIYELSKYDDNNGICPNKLLIAAEEEKVNAIQTELGMWSNREFDIARSSKNYLEIFPKSADKGKAIMALCAFYHISPEDIIAIGDQELDIPMIETAGIGIAMGNAIQELKDIADFVTLSNNEAGVAYALDHFCHSPARIDPSGAEKEIKAIKREELCNETN